MKMSHQARALVAGAPTLSNVPNENSEAIGSQV